MTKKEIIEKIRLVEVCQNSWELENLLLLTTLTDEQIQIVLTPLIEEERANGDGEVIYDNDIMVQILSDKYPKDFILSYGQPDYLTI
jgi:hypothetical protein